MIRKSMKRTRIIPSIRISEEDEKILNERLEFLNMNASEYIRLAIKDPSRIETDINWVKFKRWIMDGQK